MEKICRFLSIAFFLITIMQSTAISQEAIFIKGGDVDGIRVEAFYLSSNEITNQDFFIFIQMDGYKKPSLWDPDVYKGLDRFKNKQGDYAPRTWQSSSPPVGQEFQPLLGVSIQEAYAYARNIGKTLPTQKMWALARQQIPSMGEYPWEKDSDNSSPIRLASYYAPANLWESRFSTLQSELMQKASFSLVNTNAIKIKTLDDKYSNEVKNLKEAAEGLEKKVSESLKKQIDQQVERIATIEKKTEYLEKGNQDIVAKMQQIESKMAQNITLDDVKKLMAQSLEEMSQSVQAKVSTLEKKLDDDLKKTLAQKSKELEDQQKELEKKGKLIEGMNDQMQNNLKQIAQIRESYKALEAQVAAITKSLQTSLDEQKESLEKRQAQKIQEITNNIENKLGRLDKLETQALENVEKIRLLNVQCPSLPDGSSYAQTIALLKDQQSKQAKDINDVKESAANVDKTIVSMRNQDFSFTRLLDEIKISISSLKDGNSKMTEDVQKLKTRDDTLDAGIKENKDNIGSVLKRLEKQEKDTMQIFQQTAQIETKGKETESQLLEVKKINTEQAKKNNGFEADIANIKENVAQQEKRDVKLDEEIKNLKLADIEYNKKSVTIQASIDATKKRTDEIANGMTVMENKFKEKLGELKDDLDKTAKQLDKDFKEDIGKLTKKLDMTHLNVVAIEKQMEGRKITTDDAISKISNRIQKIENDQGDTVRQIATSATEMRRGMMEVGDKIRNLFQNEMLFGPMPGKDVVAPVSPSKEPMTEKQREEERKKLLAESKAMLVEEIKKEISKDISQTKEDIEKTKAEMQESLSQVKTVIGQTTQKFETTKAEILKACEDLLKKRPDLVQTPFKSGSADKMVADLCYRLGKVYYEYSYYPLSLECIRIAKDFGHAEGTRFYEEEWAEINCPQGMAFVESRQYLFTVNARYQTELDQKIVSEGLKLEFANSGNELSSDISIKLQKKDRAWLIMDSKDSRKYLLLKDKDILRVYKRGVAKVGNANDFENPLRSIAMKDLYIDRYEVTRKEFDDFVKSGAYKDTQYWSESGKKWKEEIKSERGDFGEPLGWSEPKPEEEKLPVVNINYYEAEAYAKWKGKRLPTPEEWEYAARGTDLRMFPWGNAPAQIGGHFKANYYQINEPRDSYNNVSPVYAFTWDKSPFGIMGMAGNVAEWCAGQYKLPEGTETLQIAKGGSFMHEWFQLQSTNQMGRNPAESFNYIGFRCVQDVPENK